MERLPDPCAVAGPAAQGPASHRLSACRKAREVRGVGEARVRKARKCFCHFPYTWLKASCTCSETGVEYAIKIYRNSSFSLKGYYCLLLAHSKILFKQKILSVDLL